MPSRRPVPRSGGDVAEERLRVDVQVPVGDVDDVVGALLGEEAHRGDVGDRNLTAAKQGLGRHVPVQALGDAVAHQGAVFVAGGVVQGNPVHVGGTPAGRRGGDDERGLGGRGRRHDDGGDESEEGTRQKLLDYDCSLRALGQRWRDAIQTSLPL